MRIEQMDEANQAGQTGPAEGMTLQEYESRSAALDAAHLSELNRVRNITRNAAAQGAMASLRLAVTQTAGVIPAAVDDIVGALYSQIVFDTDNNPFVADQEGHPRRDPDDPTRPYQLEKFARDWLRARPHFLRAGGGPQAGGSAPVTWDINRAAADMEYDQKWQKADPEGNKRAWREHLKSMSQPHYR